MSSRAAAWAAANGGSLNRLGQSNASLAIGVPAVINIVGASAGSTLTASGLPNGWALDSAARTISGTPSGAMNVPVFLTETLNGKANSPNVSAVNINVPAPAAAAAPSVEEAAFDALIARRGIPTPDVFNRKTGLVIPVGPGGQFATLNEAISFASGFKMGHISRGVQLKLKLLSSFVMREQVFAVAEDLSYMTIDTEVPGAEVVIERSAITQGKLDALLGFSSANNWRSGTCPVFCGWRGAKLPYINTLFGFDTSGDGIGTVGVYTFENSSVVVGLGKGVKRAGWRGFYGDGGWAYIRKTIWDGSGFAGGPGGDNIGMGIRGSNNSNLMAREASTKNCYYGIYGSNAYIDANDADASGCTSVGLAITDHGKMSISGAKADDCIGTGVRVDQGGQLYGGQSSSSTKAFLSALRCGGFAAVVQDGSKADFVGGDFSSTGTVAIQVDASEFNLVAVPAVAEVVAAPGVTAVPAQPFSGSATTTLASRAAIKMLNGARATVVLAKLEGTSQEVELNAGSRLTLVGATRADGATAPRTNVVGGEFSPNGSVSGVDGRRTLISADQSFDVQNTSSPELFINVALTGTRDCSMYDSTNYPWKRHTITHGSSGSPVSIYNEGAKTNRLIMLAPGDSVTLAPNRTGGWVVLSAFRKFANRSSGDADLAVTPTSQFIRSTGTITAARKLTMYAASDGAARDHTFTRVDAGAGSWSICEPNGTTVIATLAAKQWATIVPTSGGTWSVAASGSVP